MRARAGIVALLLASCAAPAPRGQITVFAAASLTGSFTTMAREFERSGGAHVVVSFGPSQTLVTQIQDGARADVIATASEASLEPLIRSGAARTLRTFARNKLVIVVPSANSANITSLRDLARPRVSLVIAAAGVPVGGYARAALAKAGVLDAAMKNVRSNEPDVTAVVQRIVLGEADAGIAYATDVTPAVSDLVDAVEIPDDQNVIATYPIASLDAEGDPFIRFVLGARGQRILRDAGFMGPA